VPNENAINHLNAFPLQSTDGNKEAGFAARTSEWQLITMSAISEQLDAKLKTLDARAASSLEKLVRDALELVETQNGAARSGHLPPDFFVRVASEFGSEPFEPVDPVRVFPSLFTFSDTLNRLRPFGGKPGRALRMKPAHRQQG